MAGHIGAAERICRAYCDEIGLCVTIMPATYVYTGGQEPGFKIGLINYPRFPSLPEDLWSRAMTLADRLRVELMQQSYSVVGPDRTVWRSWREADN
ncbi:MAG: hypothetical protein EOR34_28275 [Mesorhizobium sp.]|nr:MAG: hypothetical protein EOR14_28860 [Mesorhizobium sp.]RWJ03533.1 MAG: hypothetical protein EOR24_32240 [Mesorhizobium sp.]RWJ66455.1 MAG: hypothetical protein EOR34_28275 [Mesorhizobium sp.]